MQIQPIQPMSPLAMVPTISIKDAVALAFKQRIKVILALLIPPILGILLVIFLPPTYRASTDLIVKTGREYLAQGEGEQAMSAPTSTKQEGINSEIELLTSRPIIEATINRIGLQNLYPNLIEDPPWFDSVMDAAIKKFTHNLSVDPVKQSNVITATFDADSPKQAEAVLDTLIDVYQAKHAQVYAGGRAGSYKATMDHDVAELDRLESRRTQLKLDNHIFDVAQQRASLINQRVEMEDHLQDTISQRDSLQKRLTVLTGMRAQVPATMRTVENDKSDEMVHARQALTDLKQTEASLASRYSAGNPDLQRVRDQIKALQGNIGGIRDQYARVTLAPSPLAQQIDQELVTDQAELAPLNDEIKRYQGLVAGITDELHRIEQADLELRTIDARATALSSNLTTLQGRYDQARAEDEMDRARVVSVIQVAKALAPDKPAQPKPVLFIGGGIILGIIAAGGVVMLAMLTNKTFMTEEGVERVIGLPVLVAIPLMRGQQRKSSQLLLE